ncbi:hypothetical protein PGT21_022302 [Puccinia graminis f. sp. tritici]|uniref:Uncharacterized protein n=1 Tax=Puccinia graminis f. sp. tritici TaxID=56615 RepID=A0A5B0Q6C6_PUCGR|nr:hypothetical protein PGT21_022302 [Puccinia graminis f. sp. tritici]
MLWLEKAASPVLDDLVLVWPIRQPYECLLTSQRLQFEFRDCTAQDQPFSSNCCAGLKLSDHPESNFYNSDRCSSLGIIVPRFLQHLPGTLVTSPTTVSTASDFHYAQEHLSQSI